MANHAYVYDIETVPTPEELEVFIKAFCEDDLKGLFKLDRDGNSFIVRTLEEDPYLRLDLWISTIKRHQRTYPCIEFRHGHGTDLLWWVDMKLEQKLAVHYKGKIEDDGVGPIEVSGERANQSFRQYLDRKFQFYKEHHPYTGTLLEWSYEFSLGLEYLRVLAPSLEKAFLLEVE